MSFTFLPAPTSAQLRIYTSCPSPGTVWVALSGEIDLSTADVLRTGLLAVLPAQHPGRVEIDFAGVTFLDCSGLGVLVVVNKVAARTGCQMRIINVQPIVRRILEVSGLLDVLTGHFDRTPPAAEQTFLSGPDRTHAPRFFDATNERPAKTFPQAEMLKILGGITVAPRIDEPSTW